MGLDAKLAAAYIRVSTEEQTEYSPDAQLVEIKKYAALHGFTLPKSLIFMDEGISGKTADKRPEFNRMIGVAKQKPKPFDAILLWKFSRFARNREDSIVYKSMLRRQLGIDVISISEPLSDDKMSIIMEAMIEAMDEYYSINLAEEVKRGMTEKARRGELQTSPSFGYRAEGKTLVPIPDEAPIVRMIFEKYKDGDSLLTIAKEINNLGIRTHRGGKFETEIIKYILKNPVYIGKLRWNPAGKSHRNFSGESLITADSNHEPLVSMELWEAAQARVSSAQAKWPYHQKRAGGLGSWVAGLVKCGACGKALVASPPGWLRCCGYAHGSCGASQRVSDEKMKALIISTLKRDTGHAVPIARRKTGRRPGGEQVSALELQAKQIEGKLGRLREAYLAGAESLAEYKSGKQQLEMQAAFVKEKLASLAAPAETDAVIPEIKTCLGVLLDDSLSNEIKNKAAHKIIEQCIYDKGTDSLMIHYSLSLSD